MNGWAPVGGVLAAIWALDGLRLRTRARALPSLPASEEPVDPRHTFLVRPGVQLDEGAKRAASAFARARGLEVLDLVPTRLASWRAVILLQWLDPATYLRDRVALGVTAGDAMLVDAALLERARGIPPRLEDAVAFAEAARVLKRHAATSTDVAVAPGVRSPGIPLRERRRWLRDRYSALVVPVVALQLGLLVLTGVHAPAWGLLALVALHAQALLATAGTAMSLSDGVAAFLGRVLVDSLSTFGPAAPPAVAPTSAEGLRPKYAELLADGTSAFFEPRRDECFLCGAPGLVDHVTVGDRYQFKPGRFCLSRCSACGHIFQNPRLSLAGLSFYYRDFYDGLGGERLEGIFASTPKVYRERARLISEHGRPGRWLDVGAGHGHFCSVARDVLPETRFDGLDLSESIDDAVRRRWVTTGHRGLFPELAPGLARAEPRYDVVSMSHYLEHTLDPRAEIRAAYDVLPAGGLLFVEVPDPECALGRWLGSFWMPWFQPQHLHFVSVSNMEKLLRSAGFEPLVWRRGEAHQPVEFIMLAYMLIESTAGPLDLPWRAPSGPLRRLRHGAVWGASVPLLVFAWLLDRLSDVLARREGWSNTYRVVARRAG